MKPRDNFDIIGAQIRILECRQVIRDYLGEDAAECPKCNRIISKNAVKTHKCKIPISYDSEYEGL